MRLLVLLEPVLSKAYAFVVRPWHLKWGAADEEMNKPLLGDKLLVEVSWRIRNCLRSRDTAARFGAVEFTLLLVNLWDASAAVHVTKRLLTALREPFVIAEHEVSVAASVGIALGNAHTTVPSDLLRNADTAIYQAKATKGQYEVFRPSMHTRSLKRLKLEEDLRRTIESYGFEVYYQLQVTLDTCTTAEMEALVQWRHPRQAVSLAAMGCAQSQEFYFSKPLSCEAAGELVARNPLWRVPR